MGDNNRSKRIPIRMRMLRAVLVTVLTALVLSTLTAILCMTSIRKASERALTSQLETNLKSIVEQKAAATDAKLENYEGYIQFINDYIENMYKRRSSLIKSGHIFYAPRDTKEYMLTTGYASEDLGPDDMEDDIRFFSNLEYVWDPISRENEGLITTVYLGTKEGLMVSYDKWSYLSAVPEGEQLYYDFFQSSWYRKGQIADGIFYTDLYVDSQGRGLTITVGAPFRNADGDFAGISCADFAITGLYDELISTDLGENAFSFAIDRNGSVISPDANDTDIYGITGLTSSELRELLEDHDGIYEKKDAVYVCVPIERVGWTLCACVPKQMIKDSISNVDKSIRLAILIFILIAIVITIAATYASNKTASGITYPMELLSRDMEVIAGGDLKYRVSSFRDDEIGDITVGLNDMLDRLDETMHELVDSKAHSAAMSELAFKDSLTGIRNKTAYDDQVKLIEWDLERGKNEFGLVMIDLNNLKLINDSYGHDKGDISIRTLCKLVCDVYSHSPVFRVGGDEFIVVLRDSDYRHSEELAEEFRRRIAERSADMSIEPWERISAAIGYALYDESIDSTVKDVYTRADYIMYDCKRAMKAEM